MSKMTIGDYLLTRLKELGIHHIFGVAGDFNLGFLDQIVKHTGIEWIGACNELNGAYASDGYARIKGAGALVTTFGVGELSAINGIAGAYAEYVPIVNIVGTPSTATQNNKMLVHHTLGDGHFNIFADMYSRVTVAQAFLDKTNNAAEEIDRVLTACWLHKRPVYISIPTDVSYIPIDAPKKPLNLVYTSQPEALNQFVEQAANFIEKAKQPITLVDFAAQRFPMQPLILDFLKKTGIPFAALSMGKAIINESHPQFIGNYMGNFSTSGVQNQVEQSDCIIAFGLLLSDFNSGGFTTNLNADSIIAIHGEYARVQKSIYEKAFFYHTIPALNKRLSYRYSGAIIHTAVPEKILPEDTALRHERFWQLISPYLEKKSIIIAETGTSLFGSLQIPLPDETTYISQILWGSIGYTVGALFGACIAAPHRPTVLFIGDGSFQLTAQEISNIESHGLTPTLFLLDNDGFTVERLIHGATMPYNDIPAWNYTKLPHIFSDNVWSTYITTEKELAHALVERQKNKHKMAFITVKMDKMDAPKLLIQIAKLMAQRNQYN
jgi:TPP-dependent 2-oxoacid decarboxylase